MCLCIFSAALNGTSDLSVHDNLLLVLCQFYEELNSINWSSIWKLVFLKVAIYQLNVHCHLIDRVGLVWFDHVMLGLPW